jgi:hypothetical protein
MLKVSISFIVTLHLTAIGLTLSGSSTVNNYTQTTQNTENGTNITIKKLGTYEYITIKNVGSVDRASSLRVIPWHLPYN